MNREIRSLEYDSRRVRRGSLFFAVEGEVFDGHDFVPAALDQGAVAVVSERHPPHHLASTAAWVEVGEIRQAMALMANEFYGHPSRLLPLIGITGTNGKTTTAYLIHSILQQQGPALLMGTVNRQIGDLELPSARTTPEAVDVQRTLRKALDKGCQAGVLEVSSHALYLQRVYECEFPVAVFTNLSQDHLDFHGTMEEYFQAKSLLFDRSYNPGLRFAVLGGDDAYARRVRLPAEVSRVTFGTGRQNDAFPLQFHQTVRGSEISLELMGRRVDLKSPLVGRHNLLNVLAAAASCICLGVPLEAVAAGIQSLTNVPGRFERVDLPADFAVFVDYAHTPAALENALGLAREVAGGRLIVLFGCGGDRDREKRPEMGRIAGRLADLVVLTSDNPRGEDPEKILDDIEAGLPAQSKYERITDRRQAIARALELATPGDLVLVAGKGHETYQEIGGKKLEFDDREVAREVL